MKRAQHEHMSRRERQIMDILFEVGSATAAEVLERLPDPPSYSAVRAMLRLLEEKKLARHHKQGARYVYEPAISREQAQRSALKRLVRTFFGGSPEEAMAALIDLSHKDLGDEELDRIAQLIEKARKEER